MWRLKMLKNSARKSRSEEHTSELQSQSNLVCRLLLEKKKKKSAVTHRRALERIPLGVASNYRHYAPYPIFVQDGKGIRLHAVESNDNYDQKLCIAAFM